MILAFHKTSDHAILEKRVIIHYRDNSVVVPAGFRFDGASIPRICWTVLGLHPWHPRVRKAALFHDYLYSKGLKVLADKGFKSLLKDAGCNKFQYFCCYWAVRLFGGRHVNIGGYDV
jgi:hypothetical protein